MENFRGSMVHENFGGSRREKGGKFDGSREFLRVKKRKRWKIPRVKKILNLVNRSISEGFIKN